MKSPSQDLFLLIKTLTKSEKRYFKVHASRHFDKDNQYVGLFSAIDKQHVYDEGALSLQYKSRKSTAHFAVLKKQLYENILEAMHHYEEFSQPEQKIYKGIHYCALLLKKGLLSQCLKQLAKYKLLAYHFEKYESIIELIDIEKKVMNKMQFTATSYEQMELLQQEQTDCIEHLTTTGNYWLMSNKMYKMHYEKKITQGKVHRDFDTVVNSHIFSDIKHATTFKAKLDFLQIHALHAFVSGNVSRAYQLNTQFLQLLDTHAHLKSLFAERYFSVLNNYLIDSLMLKKYTAMLNGIATLRVLPAMPEFRYILNLEANVFRLSYLLEMNYYVSTEQFFEATQCRNAIEIGLKKYGNNIAKPNIITFRYLIAYTLFCTKNFNACLDELLLLTTIKETEKITDIYNDSKMMQLLCHFEMKNYFLVESLIISFQRMLLAQKNTQKTYKVVMRYIKHYTQKIDKPKRSDLENTLSELMKSKEEKNAFNNFNYLYWIKHISHT